MLRNFSLASLLLLLTMAVAAAEPQKQQLYLDYEISRQIFRHPADQVIANHDYDSSENRPTLRKLPVEYPGHS